MISEFHDKSIFSFVNAGELSCRGFISNMCMFSFMCESICMHTCGGQRAIKESVFDFHTGFEAGSLLFCHCAATSTLGDSLISTSHSVVRL